MSVMAMSTTCRCPPARRTLVTIHQVLHFLDDPGRGGARSEPHAQTARASDRRRFRAARARISCVPSMRIGGSASPTRKSATGAKPRGWKTSASSISPLARQRRNRSRSRFGPVCSTFGRGFALTRWRSLNEAQHAARLGPRDGRPAQPPAKTRRHPHIARYRCLLRVLPTKGRRLQRKPVGVYRTVGAAATAFCLGHLRGGREHTRTNPRNRQADLERDRACARGTPHLRRRGTQGGRCGHRRLCRGWGQTHRRAAWRPVDRSTRLCATPAGLPERGRARQPVSAGVATSKSRSQPTPRCTRTRALPRPTSTTSNARVDAGASRAITQFFFDVERYFRFVDRVRAAGITVPIVPGMLPVTNFARVQSFAEMCGTHIPHGLAGCSRGSMTPRTSVSSYPPPSRPSSASSLGARRTGVSFLHLESSTAHACDLSHTRDSPTRATSRTHRRPATRKVTP